MVTMPWRQSRTRRHNLVIGTPGWRATTYWWHYVPTVAPHCVRLTKTKGPHDRENGFAYCTLCRSRHKSERWVRTNSCSALQSSLLRGLSYVRYCYAVKEGYRTCKSPSQASPAHIGIDFRFISLQPDTSRSRRTSRTQGLSRAKQALCH